MLVGEGGISVNQYIQCYGPGEHTQSMGLSLSLGKYIIPQWLAG